MRAITRSTTTVELHGTDFVSDLLDHTEDSVTARWRWLSIAILASCADTKRVALCDARELRTPLCGAEHVAQLQSKSRGIHLRLFSAREEYRGIDPIQVGYLLQNNDVAQRLLLGAYGMRLRVYRADPPRTLFAQIETLGIPQDESWVTLQPMAFVGRSFDVRCPRYTFESFAKCDSVKGLEPPGRFVAIVEVRFFTTDSLHNQVERLLRDSVSFHIVR